MRRVPVTLAESTGPAVSPEPALVVLLWTPFLIVAAHVAVFDLLPLGLAATTLGLALAGEALLTLRRSCRLPADPMHAGAAGSAERSR